MRYFSSSKRLFSLLLCAHGIVVQKWGSTKSRCGGGGPLNAQSCWQQGLFTKGLLRLLLSLFPGSDYTHSRPCTRSGQCRQQHHWGEEEKSVSLFLCRIIIQRQISIKRILLRTCLLFRCWHLLFRSTRHPILRDVGRKRGYIGSGQRCPVSGAFSRRDSLFGGSVSLISAAEKIGGKERTISHSCAQR